MEEILTWKQIEQRYDQQWVQLVDFDWPEGKPYPKSGRVRIHAISRKEFNARVLEATPVDAARLFVGRPKIEDGVVLSASVMRLTPCD